MAALADEVMLFRLRWDGQEAWREKLLEGALFGTAIAGERIFDRMDELLEDGGRFHPDLATIYLVALALGFRGRYWRREDDGVLRLYRTALARIVTRHDPDLVAERAHLFAHAYDFTINDGRSVRLPHLRPWIAGGIALLLVFVIAGRVLWSWTTDVLTREMAAIPATVSSDE
jgi:type VI secretion system protein ImpK